MMTSISVKNYGQFAGGWKSNLPDGSKAPMHLRKGCAPLMLGMAETSVTLE